MRRKILLIFGTRPEAIKMAPIVYHLRRHPEEFALAVCVTAQHREMLDQVLRFFEITPDYDLDLMRPGQDIGSLTVSALAALGPVFQDAKPDLVLVQGDTTTALVGALAAFYHKVPIGHVEAGLRTWEKYSPYPEEMNRVLVGRLADIHFAPTHTACRNLEREALTENVFVTGNTVVDALLLCIDRLTAKDHDYQQAFGDIDFSRRIILVTGHRRESFGGPFEAICHALRAIAEHYEDVEIVYPVHLNPNVQRPVHEILAGLRGVHLLAPLDYPSLVWLMNQSHIVLTDSGGIQEEAPSLGKPVLVMRDVTERQEGLAAGTARLVGTTTTAIVSAVRELLDEEASYDAMAKASNPYGDGKASSRIAEVISSYLHQRN